MRSYFLSIVGLTFGLLCIAPIVRGQPATKPPIPKAAPQEADPKAPPAVELPLTRIVLFNAGIGYFHREGDVTGEGRLDLRFDEGDVNDLLKSLVLTDKDGGKVRAVTYDNRMPLEVTLKGFAVDVTENPTVGQLMHQVRGEKIEVTDKGGVVTIGAIVSVEKPTPPAMGPDPGESINLLTEDGLQTVELKQLKKIKFVRAELQAEFKKALELLASSREDNKKTVSVVFSGNGKRKVAVGYVNEAPLWKPSYRLSVDEKGASRIQGWAIVENTTDEDWNNVKIGLVAGRPMTFQMDLYDPLFVPRPMVEPDLFASLRPPLYQGGLNPTVGMMGMAMNPGGAGMAGAFGNQGFGGGGLGGGGNQGFGGGGFQGGGNQGFGGGGLQVGGGQIGQFGNLGGQFGLQGGYGYNSNGYLPRVPRPDIRNLYGSRLTYEDYLNRLRGQPTEAPSVERPKPVADPLDKLAGALAAAEGTLGDIFEYKIEDPVTLAKQKSAMLPLLNEAVEGTRVSIYNAATLAKYPLLGLKLVNKTKLHLAQGPVAVYDSGTFAGDARLPDIKPGETRLVSYAIDLGTEVVFRPGEAKTTLVAVEMSDGLLKTEERTQWPVKYLIRNRNPQDRVVIIEHPRGDGRKLVTPEKPTDQTRNFYRFELTVKAGELAPLDIVEESNSSEHRSLAGLNVDNLLHYSKLPQTKAAIRVVLIKAIELRKKVDEARLGVETEQAALKEIADDQDRIRKNIKEAPKESETFKRYLKKFDDQETEIEKRQARVKELKLEMAKHEKAFKEYAESVKPD